MVLIAPLPGHCFPFHGYGYVGVTLYQELCFNVVIRGFGVILTKCFLSRCFVS